MGRAKAWMMEQEERGYTAADGDICAECVTDPYLAQWITDNAEATECSFCGQESEEAIAASFDDFVGVVLAGIAFDWNHPDSEGISYITAEGGYQAEITDSSEVFRDYDISENQRMIDEIIDAIDTTDWVERDYYVGGESQRLTSAWGADGQRIDSLIYRSSRYKGAKAFVLFFENDQCAEADYAGPI